MRNTVALLVVLSSCLSEKAEKPAPAKPESQASPTPAPERSPTFAARETEIGPRDNRDEALDAANVFKPEEREIASTRAAEPRGGGDTEARQPALGEGAQAQPALDEVARGRRAADPAFAMEEAAPSAMTAAGPAPATPPPAGPAAKRAPSPAKTSRSFAEAPAESARATKADDDRPGDQVKPKSPLQIAGGKETAGADVGIGTAMGGATIDYDPGVRIARGHIARRRPRPHFSDKPYRPLPPPPAWWPRDARYRSNYLPGRGYLDHLLASLDDRTLGRADWAAVTPASPVRDALPAPRERALDMAVDQAHDLLPPSGGETTLRVRLRARARGAAGARDARLPGTRAPLRLHLVLDKSGSMSGAPWRSVCAAVRDVATRLGPDDRLSVTTYDTRGRLLSPTVSGGPAADAAAARVCATRPSGDTNIYEGLMSGYEQARDAYDHASRNRVILLSDGVATAGPRDLYTITLGTVEALGQGVTTSAVGLGDEFDALLMGRIAQEGAGNYHFVRDSKSVPAIFTDELAVLAQEVAQAVEVRVQLNPQVDLLEVVGSEPLALPESLRTRQVELMTDARLQQEKGIAADRQTDLEGGVRFLIPSFRGGDEHTFVLRVRVPAGNGSRVLARVKLRYKDLIHGRNEKLRADRWAAYAASDAEAEAALRGDVAVSEARARAGFALERASQYLDRRNLGGIRRELYAAAQALGEAAGRTGDTIVAAEAARVRKMADVAGLAERREHYPYLASLYHYGWRTSGLTSWATAQ